MSATTAVPNTAAAAAAPNRKNIIRNCTPFANYISEINNTQIDNPKNIDMVLLMYNSIEYSDKYSKTSGNLWHYYRDLADSAIADFPADNNSSVSFKFKTKIAGRIGNDGTKNVKIRVPLKYC